MTSSYLTPDEVALIVVCAVVALLGFGGIVTAVCRRGGPR